MRVCRTLAATSPSVTEMSGKCRIDTGAGGESLRLMNVSRPPPTKPQQKKNTNKSVI